MSAAKQASLERRVEIAARNLAETPSQGERRPSGGGAGPAAPSAVPAWERALEQEGLQELRYQPGVPKVFDLKVIS